MFGVLNKAIIIDVQLDGRVRAFVGKLPQKIKNSTNTRLRNTPCYSSTRRLEARVERVYDYAQICYIMHIQDKRRAH